MLLEIAQISITTSLMKVNSIIYIFQAHFQYIKQSQSVMSHLLKGYLRIVPNFVRRCYNRFGPCTHHLQAQPQSSSFPNAVDPTFNLIFYPLPSPPLEMFSRAIRRSVAPQFRRNAIFTPSISTRRTVTTDAASSHADKEAVPAVRFEKTYELKRTCQV